MPVPRAGMSACPAKQGADNGAKILERKVAGKFCAALLNASNKKPAPAVAGAGYCEWER